MTNLVSPELRETLHELLDDYLATNGPDGYPQPMPKAWRTLRDWLRDTETHGRPFHYDCNVRGCTIDGHKR